MGPCTRPMFPYAHSACAVAEAQQGAAAGSGGIGKAIKKAKGAVKKAVKAGKAGLKKAAKSVSPRRDCIAVS